MLQWLAAESNASSCDLLNVKKKKKNILHIGHIVHCYFEFKLTYLKNLKLFSIRVKELFDPIVLRKKKKKGDWFLLFLKAFSRETDLWVTLGDLAVKKQNFEGEYVLVIETKCAVRWLITIIIMCHLREKGFLGLNLNLAVIDKI